MIRIILFLFLIASCTTVNYEPNYQRETNISDQILDIQFDSEIDDIKLSSGKTFKILSNMTNNDKSILLLHGRGLYPNEPRVMNPLREGLQDEYDIFSIQLPVLTKNATYYEYKKIFKY